MNDHKRPVLKGRTNKGDRPHGPEKESRKENNKAGKERK